MQNIGHSVPLIERKHLKKTGMRLAARNEPTIIAFAIPDQRKLQAFCVHARRLRWPLEWADGALRETGGAEVMANVKGLTLLMGKGNA